MKKETDIHPFKSVCLSGRTVFNERTVGQPDGKPSGQTNKVTDGHSDRKTGGQKNAKSDAQINT